MRISDLQAWCRCSMCDLVMWTEKSPHEQSCGCSCGCNTRIHQDQVYGEPDPNFTEEEMQAILDDTYGVE